MGASEQRRQREELPDGAVVRRRCFKVDAIGMNLSRQLVPQDRPALFGPPWDTEHEAVGEECGGIGGVVVAVDLRALDVALDEVTVQVEAAEEA